MKPVGATTLLTPDCGPPCKIKAGGISGVTIRIVHCKRSRCSKCHNKPVPGSGR